MSEANEKDCKDFGSSRCSDALERWDIMSQGYRHVVEASDWVKSDGRYVFLHEGRTVAMFADVEWIRRYPDNQILDDQIDEAARACMKYVQSALKQVEKYNGTIWGYVDGWDPFKTRIRECLGLPKYRQR